MPKKSAGLLIYRDIHGQIEVFLVHPGGPFWAKKDDGAWSIPKGEFSGDEEPLEAAKREFQEETGLLITGEFQPLDPARQPSGKIIHVWVTKSNLDTSALRSNMFSIEWPRRSGKLKEFPEIDRCGWFTIEVARRKLHSGQLAFLDQLEKRITYTQANEQKKTPTQKRF